MTEKRTAALVKRAVNDTLPLPHPFLVRRKREIVTVVLHVVHVTTLVEDLD